MIYNRCINGREGYNSCGYDSVQFNVRKRTHYALCHTRESDRRSPAQRVILSLCSYGAAHETDIHLEKTDKTANLIALGGARYIYEQERLKERYNKLSMLDIELSIQEKRRNKWLSISAILISFVALVISIVSLFVS